MKYAHILAAVTEERWAMRETKLQEIIAFLQAQSSGVKYSAEEIQARITKIQEQEVTKADGGVAVLPLRGVIANRMNLMDDISGGTSTEGFGKLFQMALNDSSVKAIIIDVDSPGGAVSGTDELSQMIFDARGGSKPIISHVNAIAASAAYWIASAADEMVVTPSGSVGSIGVFGVHDDISGALDKLGVKKTIIKAGKFKADGNPYQPLDEGTAGRMQSKVDSAYDTFVRAVARNRGVSLSSVRDGFGQGDMVDAAPAVAEGMADKVGTLEETLQRFGASSYPQPKAKTPGPARRAFASAREKRSLLLSR